MGANSGNADNPSSSNAAGSAGKRADFSSGPFAEIAEIRLGVECTEGAVKKVKKGRKSKKPDKMSIG